ncbi:MAG: hypothetical protein GXO85_02305 [Chlorobi bacterium]|nr:hypothetical protein [Chlorobiota bacterium]
MSINKFLEKKESGHSDNYPCKIQYQNAIIQGKVVEAKVKKMDGRFVLFALVLGDNNRGYSILKESYDKTPDWDTILEQDLKGSYDLVISM